MKQCKNCNVENTDEAKFCTNCGQDLVTEAQEEISSEKNPLEGLGGWLILVGIGIIISPFVIIAQLLPVYSDVFQSGAWDLLTTPGSELYTPGFSMFVVTEMIVNAGMLIAWLYIALLFFTKKKKFSKWYIGILIFTPTFIFIDAVISGAIFPNEAMFDQDTVKNIGRGVVSGIIWVWYMLVSKRVKATFVN